MGSSLLIAVGTVLLSILLSSMTAFAFAHIRFFGSKYLLAYLMVGLLFPAATGILPLFIKMRDLGMLDSHWGIIIVQAAFSISFSVLLFYNFFKELPKELVDAARMDNCGYIRIYWYVTLPLSLPIIATVGVFNFVTSWNNFLLPLIALNSEVHYTWPLGIMQFQGEYGSDWPRILAYLTLTIIPAIAFFLLAQRYIISGLTGGAVKG
jgi:raffinose/stachyose/melibiose transport system permease protein